MSLGSVLQNRRLQVDGDGWLPVADMMAGLMLVFVFVASLALTDMPEITELNEQQYLEQTQERETIVASLQQEFAEDLNAWGASIDQATLSFDFGSPELNFGAGSAQVQDNYRKILDDFFPRYLAALEPHMAQVEEVRIEGHASSDWSAESDETDAWFENMALSQQRTRAVLRYVYGLSAVQKHRDWIRQRVTAVGMSSARLVRNADGSENESRSRRVSFRLLMSSDQH